MVQESASPAAAKPAAAAKNKPGRKAGAKVAKSPSEKPVAEAFPRNETERTEMATTRATRSQRDELRLNFRVYGELPGYHLHGIVDDGGDIEAAIQDGYEFVKPGEVGFSSRGGDVKEVGERVSIYGGTNEGGNPYRVYLMKIKQEEYDRVQQARQQRSDEAIQHVLGGRASPFQGQYQPSKQSTFTA